MPKFIEPMLSEHISGVACSGAASRWSTVMLRPPPVVMLITASVACLIRGRNCMNTAGSGVGRPSSGSRACRCRIAAPASAAPIAWLAMSSGVTGSAADMVGVWMPPVMAQLMMTFFDRSAAIFSFSLMGDVFALLRTRRGGGSAPARRLFSLIMRVRRHHGDALGRKRLGVHSAARRWR